MCAAFYIHIGKRKCLPKQSCSRKTFALDEARLEISLKGLFSTDSQSVFYDFKCLWPYKLKKKSSRKSHFRG